MTNADTQDASDFNVILRNVIGPLILAEAVDVKEGTLGNRIELNRIDSTGIRSVDSAVDIKGNSMLILSKVLAHTPSLAANYLVSGMQSHALTVAGIRYGQSNIFSSNAIDMNATQGTANFIALPVAGYAVELA
jgi:hypothetical protein